MAKRMTIMVIVCALILGGIIGFQKFKEKMIGEYFANFKQPPVTVSTAEVQQTNWVPYLESIGTVKAVQGVDVSNEVSGVIRQINFNSGQTVSRGQLLVQLDTDADEANLRGLLAEQRLAEANFSRDQRLLERNVASKTDFETTQARLSSTQAQVENQQALIRKKSIIAPFSGTLGIRQVNLGQYLQPGTEIVTLQSLDEVYIEFSMPEQRFSQLVVGQPVEARLATYPDEVFSGKVTAINARVDARTRNVLVQALFTNGEQKLRPGMFADVRVLLPVQKDVIIIPRVAIDFKLYGQSVFLVQNSEEKDEQGNPIQTVVRQYIETGTRRGNWIEVLKGLEPGQTVVSAGQLKLQNGSQIEVNNKTDIIGNVPVDTTAAQGE